MEPNKKPKIIYTDNSKEFDKTCEDLFLNHRTSKPHKLETNGIAERAFRKLRLQFGCIQVWMKHGGQSPWNAILINETLKISCLLGNTPYERRFGEPFKGPIIPFRSRIEYRRVSAQDQ